MNKILSVAFKFIAVATMLFIIALTGSCFYNGLIALPDRDLFSVPNPNTGGHYFYIGDTKDVILTDKYEEYGEVAGQRIFVLHDYWEVKSEVYAKYKRAEGDVLFPEYIFGEIDFIKR